MIIPSKRLNCSISSMDGTRTSTTTPGQSRRESNGNEGFYKDGFDINPRSLICHQIKKRELTQPKPNQTKPNYYYDYYFNYCQ